MNEISAVVRGQILENMPAHKQHIEFTETSSLIETGILDSVGVFDLVAFLESRFGIEIPDTELAWKNFETVQRITGLVESQLAGAPRS